LESLLMASCVGNVCTKNRQNPLILLKLTIDNVGVPFLRHSVETKIMNLHFVADSIFIIFIAD